MLRYIAKRLLQMIPMLFLISVVSFIIIQLPPGSYLNTLIAQMRTQGDEINMEQVEALRIRVLARQACPRPVPKLDQRNHH